MNRSRAALVEPVEVIRSSTLAGLPHGFLGRRGGVSSGVVAGLNIGLGADDAGEAVIENRRRAVDAVMPRARLVTVHQIHSPRAVIVDEPWSQDARPQADALVTDKPGLLLGVVTADCAPVLLADRAAGVVAAAHAGWRGAHAGVIASTVAAMESLGATPANIVAAIGPAIAQASYEVDDIFRSGFDAYDEYLFVPARPGHWRFDLPGYVARRLGQAGVGQIDRLELDTYADPARFFSYRRTTHSGEPAYGRQFSLIGLPE